MSERLDPTWLEETLSGLMPREGAGWRMRLVPSPTTKTPTGVVGDDLWACIEKVVLPGEKLRIADVTILILGRHRGASRDRAAAFLEGWLAAAAEVLDELTPEHLGLAMPRNLATPRALELARPKTVDDWKKALLAPSRLGRLLGPAPGRFLGGQG